MNLRGWRIDGFGVFAETEVDDLSPGLTLFYGPNEAGKSTLLAFLQGALFGFLDGRHKSPLYPPLHGGNHGGRVTLRTEAGEVVVARRASGRGRKLEVALPDGREGSDADLNALLGHADRGLYRSVFAFSLTELQDLMKLTGEGVQEHVFAAGITGAGRSARSALDALGERADRLYRPKARKGRVHELTRELAAAERELAARRERARGHAVLQAQERELHATVATLREDAQRERAAAQRAALLGEIWGQVWSPLREDRDALAKLEPRVGFPEDGEERLERASARIATARDRLRETQEERGGLEVELETLVLDRALEAAEAEVLRLHQSLALYRKQGEERTAARKAAEEAEAQVAAVMRDLGSDWDAERLEAYDDSLAHRDEIRHWRNELEAGQRALSELEHGRAALEARLERARAFEGLQRGERDRVPIPVDGDAAGRFEIFARVRGAGVERVGAASRLESEAARLARDEQRVEARRPRPALTAAWMVLSCGGAAGLYLWAGDMALAVGPAAARVGDVAAVIGGLLALGAASIFGMRRRRWRRAEEELSPQRALCDELARQIGEADEVMTPSCEGLGIAPPTSQAELTACEQEMERERAQWAEWTRLDERVRGASTARAECEGELESHADQVDSLRRRVDERENRWQSWKRASGVPASLTPATVPEFFDGVRRGREALAARRVSRHDANQLDEALQVFETQVRRVFVAAGGELVEVEAAGGDELIGRLLVLVERGEVQRRAREHRVVLESQLAKLEAPQAMRVEELEEARGELSRLLSDGGCEDVDEFRRRISHEERRRELEARRDGRIAELERRIGRGREAEALHAELETGRVTEWEREAADAREATERAEARRDEALVRHTEVAGELDALRQSTDVVELELRRNSLQAALRESLEEWRRLRVASGLIRATLDRFERERQPRVLKEAGRLFSRVTGGRYKRIVLSVETDDFSVLDHSDGRKRPADLSRGTKEQLYLCIRLGLVAEFARRTTPLPVVMDDVLVNFDDDRARAMVEVLREFASEHQLLFFTCSAHTRDLFRQVAPDLPVRELEPRAPAPDPSSEVG